MTPPRLGIALCSLLFLCGCKEDLCKQEAPSFELELTLAGGVPSGITTLEVQVTVLGSTRSERFAATPLIANGRATVRVLLGALGQGGFQASVVVKALGSADQILARGEQSFSGTGDACNFFSIVLGATGKPDAGPDRSPDLMQPDRKPDSMICPSTDQIICGGVCVSKNDPKSCGSCGNICAATEPCKQGLCEVTLGGGTLSGLQSHPGKRVLLTGTIKVASHNGIHDTESCDAGETGCLRILAAQIVLGAGAVIDAAGSGYGGGGGGGGARGYSGDPTGGTCQAGGAGGAGAGTRGGKSGSAGTFVATSTTGGAGGGGGGLFGGAGGGAQSAQGDEGAKAGNPGSPGGYRAAGANGDSSQNELVWVGSGGGGGSGGAAAMNSWYFSVGGSGGGGAGNAGGGAVILDATESLTVAGTIQTDGYLAKTGDGGIGTDGKFGCQAAAGCCDLTGSGGVGGNATDLAGSKGGSGVLGYFATGWDDCVKRNCADNGSTGIAGGNGGGGGAGAGGGVLLRAPTLAFSGTVSALGGGGNAANGGTVKLFYKNGAPSTAGITAHHTVVKAY